MKQPVSFVALALCSLQVAALELAKHPQAFDAGQGVSLILAPTADGKQALVQVKGINHPLDEVVFLVSDFLSTDWERAMRITAKRHELVPVVVGDPLEQELPPVGLVVLEDLETGEVVEVDTTAHARSAFAKAAKKAAEQRDQMLRRINLDVVTATTNEPV